MFKEYIDMNSKLSAISRDTAIVLYSPSRHQLNLLDLLHYTNQLELYSLTFASIEAKF